MSISLTVGRKSRVSSAEKSAETEESDSKIDVAIIAFSIEDQETLKIVIGQHLTIDRPWKTVSKELLLKVLEGREGRAVKKLNNYKYSEVLIGFQAGSQANDGHLVCLTERGRDKILTELSLLHMNLAERVRQYLNRSPQKPPKLEKKFELSKPRRPPITYEWVGQIDSRARKVNFGSRKQADTPAYSRILCKNKESIKLVESAVQHAEVLATPECQNSAAQTEPEISINDCTQFVPEVDLPTFTELTPEGKAKLAAVCKTYCETMMEAAGYNSLFDLYKDDYSELLTLGAPITLAKTGHYKHYMSFSDISQFEGKLLTSLSWHPNGNGTVAVSYGNLTANRLVRLESDSEDENYQISGQLDVWAKNRKISTIQDKDTRECDSWRRSIRHMDAIMTNEYNETQWEISENTLDIIEATMNIREYEVHCEKLREESISTMDAGPDEYDMYYLPYGDDIEINESLMKMTVANN